MLDLNFSLTERILQYDAALKLGRRVRSHFSEGLN